MRNENNKNVYMHRQILELVASDGIIGDHRNFIAIDNGRKNLRSTNRQGNSANARLRSDKIGLAKGVKTVPNCPKRPYVAQIVVSGKLIHLGHFATVLEAHMAYCEAATNHFGEFARFE